VVVTKITALGSMWAERKNIFAYAATKSDTYLLVIGAELSG